MKATAGLHHPIRHDTSDGASHHGFLNLAVATTLSCAHTLNLHMIERIVEERNPHAFTLSAPAIGWRDISATAADVNTARENLFSGIGSCSFDEPVEDLTGLGILPL
jgi:hypothetical protein